MVLYTTQISVVAIAVAKEAFVLASGLNFAPH